jgi:hypothetical protein
MVEKGDNTKPFLAPNQHFSEADLLMVFDRTNNV